MSVVISSNSSDVGLEANKIYAICRSLPVWWAFFTHTFSFNEEDAL